MNKLEIKKVSKYYGKKHALKSFDFIFSNGIYGLLGPNGAGKSTLMNLISGNLKHEKDGGKILWNGIETYKLNHNFQKILGFMPQQQNLYDNMTAYDFMGYISALKNIDKLTAKKEIQSLLEKVELQEDAHKKIGGFSGGMKQRLLIASSLLGDPKLLIMDEPTAGLDPKQRVIIKKLTKELSNEMIIIISTHIISDIENIAKEILLIKEGVLIESGTPDSLISSVPLEEKSLENLYMYYYGDE